MLERQLVGRSLYVMGDRQAEAKHKYKAMALGV